MTDVLYLICPFCGRTAPLYGNKNGKKTTMKALDEVWYLGLIQKRRCIGRRGFINIDGSSPIPLRDMLSDPVHGDVCLRLANEEVDLCSGILTYVWENDVPVTMPSLLNKLQKLSDGDKEVMREDDAVRLKLDDSLRQIASLESENQRLLHWKDNASLQISDYRRDIIRLEQQVGEVTRSDDGFRLQHDDLVRENNRLRDENNRLRKDLQYRDEVIRMYENRSLMQSMEIFPEKK